MLHDIVGKQRSLFGHLDKPILATSLKGHTAISVPYEPQVDTSSALWLKKSTEGEEGGRSGYRSGVDEFAYLERGFRKPHARKWEKNPQERSEIPLKKRLDPIIR